MMPITPMPIFRYATHQSIELFERYCRHLSVIGVPLERRQEQAIAQLLGNQVIIQDVDSFETITLMEAGEILILSDNLFLTPEFLHAFLSTAQQQPVNHLYGAALSTTMPIVRDFVQPLCSGPVDSDRLCLGLFYAHITTLPFPIARFNTIFLPIELLDEPLDHLALPPLSPKHCPDQRIALELSNISPSIDIAPLRINTGIRLALPIEHWVHLLTANIPFGLYSDAVRFRDQGDLFFMDGISQSSQLSQSSKQMYSHNIRELVIIGDGCQIDPSATIIGPTILGKNVKVGPNATIVSSVLGDRCIVGQGNHIRLSVFEEGVILPPGTNIILWSVIGRGSLVNSSVRFSVLGKECFIGAATYITDRILDHSPLDTLNPNALNNDVLFGGRQVKVKCGDHIIPSGYWILGAAIGNRTKTGSGTILYPGRELPPDSLTLLHTGDGLPFNLIQ